MARQRVNEKIRGLLRQLPAGPESIAERFRAKGIKGDGEVPESCPIANYLLANLTEEEKALGTLCVFGESAGIVPDEAGGLRWAYQKDHPEEFVPLDPSQREFIELFDGGCWPELHLGWTLDDEDYEEEVF